MSFVIMPRHPVDGSRAEKAYSDPPMSAFVGKNEGIAVLPLLIFAGTRFAPIHQGGFSASWVGINHFMKICTAGLMMTLALCMGVNVMRK